LKVKADKQVIKEQVIPKVVRIVDVVFQSYIEVGSGKNELRAISSDG
jgi:hypothetical protein